MVKMIIKPNSFFSQALNAIDLPTEEELYKIFQERYKDRLQKMYDSFIWKEVVERLWGKYPVLTTKIDATSLSNRAKNVLQANDIRVIGDLVSFTPDELRTFRKMGAGTVKEIEEFVASLRIK